MNETTVGSIICKDLVIQKYANNPRNTYYNLDLICKLVSNMKGG